MVLRFHCGAGANYQNGGAGGGEGEGDYSTEKMEGAGTNTLRCLGVFSDWPGQ